MKIHDSPPKPSAEYVLLVAMLISIGALGTDVMLPALDIIGRDLGAKAGNDVHYIVTAFFLGMAAGQLIAGPLSDRFGRKPVIYVGYALFILGSIFAMMTESWSFMLAARILQGFGAAAPRVVTVALVRDVYAGRDMARIMSIVMAAFILVPILAPMIGYGLIYLGGWRATFLGLAVLGLMVLLWFALRQAETLEPIYQRPFHLNTIWKGVLEIARTRVAMGYTVATGLVYGMFVGYLGSAQQVFEVTFQVGNLFVAYFALAAASLGAASLLNASLLARWSIETLTWAALIGLTIVSFGMLVLLLFYSGVPPFPIFLAWLLIAFFCVGITFGNLNALALEPLGHMAGLAAGFIGSLAMFISLPLAALMGHHFDGTVYPLVSGFAILGLAACGVVNWTQLRHRGSLRG